MITFALDIKDDLFDVTVQRPHCADPEPTRKSVPTVVRIGGKTNAPDGAPQKIRSGTQKSKSE